MVYVSSMRACTSPLAENAACDAQVFLDRHQREDVFGLRHEGEALADPQVGGTVGDVAAIQQNLAACHRDQARR